MEPAIGGERSLKGPETDQRARVQELGKFDSELAVFNLAETPPLE